jgi:hypothetical protein
MSDLVDLEVGFPLFEAAFGAPLPKLGLKSLKQLRHELLLLPNCLAGRGSLQGVFRRYREVAVTFAAPKRTTTEESPMVVPDTSSSVSTF